MVVVEVVLFVCPTRELRSCNIPDGYQLCMLEIILSGQLAGYGHSQTMYSHDDDIILGVR